MTAPLSVRLVDDEAAFQALAREADCLAERMQPRLPFAMSGWLVRWWQHYHEDRLLVRDRLFVHALRDAQGVLVALAPLVLTARPGNGPIRARGIAFFGADKNVTELRGLICAPEHEAAATRALLSYLSAQVDAWDWFVWNGIVRDSEAHAVLSQSKGFHWTGDTTDYVLALPTTWEEFRASRSRNIKESLRKCYNSLKRDGHEFAFRVVSEQAALPAALEQFFELHSKRANAPHLLKHEDVFKIPRARSLLADLAASGGEGFSLHVFQLEIAGKVVASRLGFGLGNELYLYFSGYDPAWGAYSVMTTTVAESIKWAIGRGFRLVNLSPGTDVSKTRWGATPITTSSGVLVSSLRRSRIAFETVNGLRHSSRQGTLLGRFVERARRNG